MGNKNKVNKRYVGCYGNVNKGINYRECALSSLWESYYVSPHNGNLLCKNCSSNYTKREKLFHLLFTIF